MIETSAHQAITCDACGDPCEVVTADFGRGPYEYWGFRGVDRDIRTVSRCCEATFTDPNADDEEHTPYVLAPDDKPPF